MTTLAFGLVPATTYADPPPSREPEGRPKVILNRLDFPVEMGAARYKKALLGMLRKEAARADWGAGSGDTIEYRFEIERLTVKAAKNSLRVHCSAIGRLPKGRTARSQLTFSGDPRYHGKLVSHVMGIVARGVIVRLAEIERVRRGRLPHVHVRAPST